MLKGLANERYTVDGDDALEQHVDSVCERVKEGLTQIIPKSGLHGVLLGGSYGRGEGGVLRTPDGDMPYEDFPFAVLIHGSVALARRRFSAALAGLGRSLQSFAGVEVGFHLMSRRRLRKGEVSLARHDLVCGHRTVLGPPDLFSGCAHHADASALPLHEATRLLLSRGAGLLFALDRLRQKPFRREDGEFVLRTTAQAKLALGDAFLASNGLYHFSVRVRASRLQRLRAPPVCDGVEEVLRHHAEGAAFTLHPQFCREGPEGLLERLRGVLTAFGGIFLWQERKRLGIPFAGIPEYVFGGVDKCPETSRWENLFLNCGCRGTARPFALRELFRHPRQRLLHAMALLLWGRSSFRDPAFQQQLSGELLSPCPDLGAAVKAYRSLWLRFG